MRNTTELVAPPGATVAAFAAAGVNISRVAAPPGNR